MDASTNVAETQDVVVIGGGQAGLAAGYWLKKAGAKFVIADRGAYVGQSWRERYDSLTLFTSREYCALPGLAFPGAATGYPHKDEMADYLARYAVTFDLPVRLGAAVTRLSPMASGYAVELNGGQMLVHTKSVVIATGSFQLPKVPMLAAGLSSDVRQYTMTNYRNPAGLPTGTILVVGDGASGRQIAREIAGHRRVLLATGAKRNVSPQRVLGKDIFWWLDRLGVLWAGSQTRVGALLRERNPFPGKVLELKSLARTGVEVRGRLAGFEDNRATFAEGNSVAIGAVIWAVGYRDEVSWVDVDGLLNGKGQFKDVGLDAVVPGIYFVGRSWQSSRASALICGVGRDAQRVVQQWSSGARAAVTGDATIAKAKTGAASATVTG